MRMLRSTKGFVDCIRVVFLLLMFFKRGESLECLNCKSNECHSFREAPWCKRCVTGFYWVKGQCFECDRNCNCSSHNCDQICKSNFGECIYGCNQGFFQHNDTDKYYCERCDVNCKSCDDEKCITCQEGYDLHNGKCNKCSVKHCKTCLSGANCGECEDGYHLKDSQQCSKDISAEGNQSTNKMVIIGAAVGGAMFLVCFVVGAVIFMKRRNEKEDGNNLCKENANLPNADIGLQNRVEADGNQISIAMEDNTYALPNKFRTQNENYEKQKEQMKLNVKASVSLEPPVIPVKSSLYYEDSDLEELDPNIPDNNEDTGDVPEDSDTYYNTFVRRKMRKETLLAKLADNSIEEFKDEYEALDAK